ncbi:bifunctional DNA-formamidopyrimidine glycosylase/DNA-(apurinic or apyrimidinic site) lyase [Candidatus Anaplasma sp. TIGMIC]|uniref:bifunctional DNA-formamidopyrimidine glycosylase/DNA-(apurinic or apyrimidinic site) lyase n=1 Tax=Candidatus Anaplasma sp. TIGMIC TaxID=3020713 RepID=UPI00232B1074|nr:bifunctional DNA-formamidopyrimidine glycosylase/DNA-(apurinic or apyrimidinic site) lyase [Candidatus Anaplasma sp. TIGMIC]MDB1135778.1 bifunctional DNA-formamidopyrimidine glycosylase/DNA-(apurinic or apyrimidinic site) lyase [Candidatus Anaplasma sp. TIGMIC]
MPELPEVEIIARFFSDSVVGKRICDITINRRDLRISIPDNFSASVLGKKIHSVRRLAKYLVMQISAEEKVIFHLGMSGRILYVTSYSPEKHDHVILTLNDGSRIVFNDPRRFGMVTVVDNHGYEALREKAGPDPFSDCFSADYILSISNKLSIKTALMRSDIVSGIGNIYASEILFRAGILPNREMRTLSLEDCQRIVDATREILRLSIEAGGSTIRDYRSPLGTEGGFPRHFKVYNRSGCECYTCGGYVHSERQNGRSTYFCVRCQK